MIRRFFALFGIHIHEWDYFEMDEWMHRECTCGRLQQWIPNMAAPSGGWDDGSWMDVDE